MCEVWTGWNTEGHSYHQTIDKRMNVDSFWKDYQSRPEQCWNHLTLLCPVSTQMQRVLTSAHWPPYHPLLWMLNSDHEAEVELKCWPSWQSVGLTYPTNKQQIDSHTLAIAEAISFWNSPDNKGYLLSPIRVTVPTLVKLSTCMQFMYSDKFLLILETVFHDSSQRYRYTELASHLQLKWQLVWVIGRSEQAN